MKKLIPWFYATLLAVCVGLICYSAFAQQLSYPPSTLTNATVQRTTVVTDASGNWAVTWATAFASSAPTVNPIPMNPSASSPYTCNVLTRSATGATGKCWQVASQTVALISLTIALSPSAAPTSTSVMIIAAEPTQ